MAALRTAARAEVINRRSMVAIKRPNRPLEGTKPMEAVLDMIVPFSKMRQIAASSSGDNLRIPDTRNNSFVCIAAYCLLQCNINASLAGMGQAKGRRKPAASKHSARSGGLFGGNLPRRVERAGIVDLRHPMISKAETLPQDLVGVLAEQRGPRYFAWAVRHLDGIANREVFAALGMIHLDYGAGGAQ